LWWAGRGNGLCCGKKRKWVGLPAELGWKRGKERREKEKSFPISKPTQANEFKPIFESKHPKTMHQYECNSKLLYFIN
jgi:hypothetical protein